MPSMRRDLAGAGAGDPQGAVGGADVAEPAGLLEGDVVREVDQRVLRRGHELGETPVRVQVEDPLPVPARC